MSTTASMKYWVEHYQKWQSSGQTQQAYCESLGLKRRQFEYWNGRWRKQSQGASGETTLDRDGARTQAFVPVKVAPSAHLNPACAPGSTLVLHHEQGWKLELPTTIDAGWFAQVLRGLS